MALGPTDIALVAAGPLTGLINQLFAKRQVVWHLKNLDSGEELEGQFAPIGPTETVGAVYAEHTSLNRQNAIIQYLRGTTPTYSFTARFYALHSTDTKPEEDIATLKSWTKRQADLGRPPRVTVTVGNQVPLPEAVIEEPLSVAYVDDALPEGAIRGADCTINLRNYHKFSLDTSPEPSTRYHRSRTGDYYELLAWYEYANPLLGDVVRKEHPDKQTLSEGDVVRLPSLGAIKGTTVKPTSTALQKSIGTKDTAQRRLRQSEFERHDRSYVSAIVPEGLG